MDIHEFMKQREVEETAIQEHNSKIKDLEGREYIQAYHSGLDEKRANEQVGLTWKDMWKIEDEISDVYYYNIELSGEKR
jgi:hypothetical protein